MDGFFRYRTSRWARAVLRLICGALLLVPPAGCVHGEFPDAQQRYYVRLSLSPAALQQTRSDTLTYGLRDEARLHSLQIWLFNSGGTGEPLVYQELDRSQLNAYTDSYGNVSVVLPVEGGRLTAARQVDFYLAANAASVGLSLPGDASRTQLEQAVFSGYSPLDAVHSVPDGGLPMSRIVRDVDLSDYLSTASAGGPALEIPLVRSVSKLRFFFVRPQGMPQAVVRRIVLSGGAIPEQVRFFPLPVPSGGYHASELVLTPQSGDVYEHSEPRQLIRRSSESVQNYLDRISEASVSDFGLTYLKETDRALSGTIWYTTGATGDVWQSVSFGLAPGEFPRNREWIIYAWFSRDRLYLHPLVADWTDGGLFSFEWGYTSTLINQSGAENTRILTTGGQSYVQSAYGLSSSGLPYAPKLQLDALSTESAGARMMLMLDNPDSGFRVEEEGVLSELCDRVEFPIGPVQQSVIFYVVPRRLFDLAGPNPENPVASLRLYLLSDRLASIRLPFNALGLPGDQEQILFHYVTPDAFR